MSFVPTPPGRCNGVLVASFQTPCRSGSPHGVFNGGVFFGATFAATLAPALPGAPFCALFWAASGYNDARIPTEVRSRYFILCLLAFLNPRPHGRGWPTPAITVGVC